MDNFGPPVSDIISRSLITASFSQDDRFDWTPDNGLRVGVPDRYSFIKFARASAAELRNRLFLFPNVRGHNHKSALQPSPLPERSLAWWYAQLIHYGFPITCDRDHAKEAIKRAILADRLAVPLRLRELETKLKRQYVVVPAIRPGMVEPEVRNQSSTETGLQNAKKDEIPKTSAKENSTAQAHKSAIVHGAAKRSMGTNSIISKSKDYFSLYSNESDLTSSSESEEEPETRYGQLFTPKGDRMVKPMIFSGLVEKDRAENERKARSELQKAKERVEAQAAAKKANKIADLAERRDTSASDKEEEQQQGNDDDDDDDDVDEHQEQKGFSSLPNVESRPKKGTASEKESMFSKNTRANEEKDEDETGSLIFYTPMEFLRKRLEDPAVDDEGSVIFSSSRSKQSHKQNKNDATQTSKDKEACGTAGARSSKLSKVEAIPSKTMKMARDKPAQSRQFKRKDKTAPVNPTKMTHIIEISSDQDDSSDESCSIDSNAPEHIVCQPRKSPANEQIKTSKHQDDPKKKSSTKVESNSNLGTRRRNGTPGNGQSVSTAEQIKLLKRLPTPSTEVGFNQKVAPANVLNRHDKLAKHIHDGQGSAELSTMQRAGDVRDYTGYGITEMHGALHSDDEGANTNIEDRTHDLSVMSPPQSAARGMTTSFQYPPSLPSSPSSDDPDFCLSSTRGLLSSQQTPENWKLKSKLSTSDKKKRAQIEKSYDSDSVPTLREALLTIPEYLKTSIRHDSPELSQSASQVELDNKSAPVASKVSQRSRSQSISKAHAPSKRVRTSMLDIEADFKERPATKRPRLTAPQPESTSVVRVTSSTQCAMHTPTLSTNHGGLQRQKLSKSEPAEKKAKKKKHSSRSKKNTSRGEQSAQKAARR